MQTAMAKRRGAYICARDRHGWQLAKDVKLICQSVGVYFFLFCQSSMDGKFIYQTVGVALTRSIDALVVFMQLGASDVSASSIVVGTSDVPASSIVGAPSMGGAAE
jgi:hypothetical protein